MDVVIDAAIFEGGKQKRMSIENRPRPEYDFPTAVTFLLAGIAMGAVLAMLFSPLPDAPRSDQPSVEQSFGLRQRVPVPVE